MTRPDIESAANALLVEIPWPTGTHPTTKQHRAVELAELAIAASDSARLSALTEVAEIERLWAATTPGTWASQGYFPPEDGIGVIAWPAVPGIGASDGLVAWVTMSPTEQDEGGSFRAEKNALFIGAAHQVVPALLAHLSTLQAQLERAREALGKWMAAALDDPNVCEEMKADIRTFFEIFS
jgi:hypothetical protein